MTDKPFLMLVEKSDHCVAFIDLATLEVTARIKLADFPHEMVVDRDRRVAYVGQYGVRTGADVGDGGAIVFVVDLENRTLLHTLDCRPFRRIHGLSIDRQGRLYALSEAAGVLLVFDDPLHVKSPSKAASTGGLKSHLVSVTADGQVALSMNLLTHTVSKFAPHDASIVPISIVPGVQPEGNCLSADEQTLFVTNRGSASVARINVANFTLVETAAVRPDPTRIYVAGADHLIVTHFNGRGLSFLNTGSLRELWHIPFEGRPAAACVSPFERRAYVSLDTNELLEIDLDNAKIVTRRVTGAEPDSCVMINSLKSASSELGAMIYFL